MPASLKCECGGRQATIRDRPTGRWGPLAHRRGCRCSYGYSTMAHPPDGLPILPSPGSGEGTPPSRDIPFRPQGAIKPTARYHQPPKLRARARHIPQTVTATRYFRMSPIPHGASLRRLQCGVGFQPALSRQEGGATFESGRYGFSRLTSAHPAGYSGHSVILIASQRMTDRAR